MRQKRRCRLQMAVPGRALQECSTLQDFATQHHQPVEGLGFRDAHRNSPMMASRSFCGMSPCMADTVKLFCRIFSVSQSTFRLVLQKMTACRYITRQRSLPTSEGFVRHQVCRLRIGGRAQSMCQCRHRGISGGLNPKIKP